MTMTITNSILAVALVSAVALQSASVEAQYSAGYGYVGGYGGGYAYGHVSVHNNHHNYDQGTYLRMAACRCDTSDLALVTYNDFEQCASNTDSNAQRFYGSQARTCKLFKRIVVVPHSVETNRHIHTSIFNFCPFRVPYVSRWGRRNRSTVTNTIGLLYYSLFFRYHFIYSIILTFQGRIFASEVEVVWIFLMMMRRSLTKQAHQVARMRARNNSLRGHRELVIRSVNSVD